MGDYLVTAHDPGNEAGTVQSAALRRHAEANGMTIRELNPNCWLGRWGARPVKLTTVGPWSLIGDVLDRRKPNLDDPPIFSPWSYEKKLFARVWGRFVGLSFGPRGALTAVLRDPSGSLECLTWNTGALTLVSSHVPPWLVTALRPDWRIDFERVSAALHDPLLTSGMPLLTGLTSVLPGSLQPLPSGEPVVLWRPDWIAARRNAASLPEDAAAAMLCSAVEEAVEGFLGLSDNPAVEISGGLDSSLVAASARSESREQVRCWMNAYGPDRSADERHYVADLAEHLSITPDYIARATGVVTPALLQSMPHGIRPALAGLDGLHDADWASRFRRAGVEAVLTGKGGDSLFIQPANTLVYQDVWHSLGWRALGSPALPRLSRWTERSVWSLVSEAIRRPPPTRNQNALLRPLPSGDRAQHPWMTDIDHLAPGKVYQIAGLVNALQFHGRSLQSEAVDVLHPLLAMPVVELCLSLSTPALTCGRRDRGLARLAFTDRLPKSILDRRSKGEMTAFYGHMIAGGLDVLRPWLLDGRLAEEGLIDRDRASVLLTPESLIWRGGYVEIMLTAAFEGWVRHWEAILSPSEAEFRPESR
ncbi:asparagine synthase-related protein [Brevundimonas variabilis]|nr:asparagine synthase C-terminal domain-containing protein [Brevundimonas variabilis]